MQPFAVIVLALLIAAQAAATTVHYSDLARADQMPVSVQTRATFDTAADDRSMLVALEDLLGNRDIDPIARDLLLVDGALRMANLAPSFAGDRLLQALAKQPVTHFVEHEHAGRSTLIPACDVAAAARYALQRRARQAAADALVAATSTGATLDDVRSRPGAALKASDGPAVALAIARMDLATLAAAADSIGAALPRSPELAEAATAAALRLDDERLLVSVVRHGGDEAAVEALRAAMRLNSTQARHRVIEAAVRRPHTRALALTELARLVADDPAYTMQLLTWLDEPQTAFAAAAAIAQLERPDLAARVADRLDQVTDPQHAAALALSLSLMQNEVAVRRLDAYLETPGGAESVKAKLRRARPAATR